MFEAKKRRQDRRSQAKVRHISKMVINPMPPQSCLDVSLPSDNDFASKSQFRSYSEEDVLQILCQQLFTNFWADRDELVSQQYLKCTMDDQPWFQQPMAADSGDEVCTVRSSLNPDGRHRRGKYLRLPPQTEGLCNDFFPGADTNTPYGRTQTAAASVSAVNPGWDFDPSHTQQNKETAGNEQMFLTNLRTSNGYARGYGASNDPQNFPWQTYNTTVGNQVINYAEFPDGLANNCYSNLPVFGELPDGLEVIPNSFSSPVPSSGTSEAMAAMSLSPMAVHSNATESAQGHDSVTMQDNSGNAWTSCPSTISPKMLRLQPSPTPTSSSESIHANLVTGGDSDMGASSFEHPHSHHHRHHHARDSFPSQRSTQKQRKDLPSKPGRPRPAQIASPGSSTSKDKTPAPPSHSVSIQQTPHKTRSLQVKQESQDDMSSSGFEGSSKRDNSHSVRIGDGGRSAKDEFLVRSKLSGMTYREIRRKGNFTEAESTLRGRFRTLTKDKEARKRKPEWQENDVSAS